MKINDYFKRNIKLYFFIRNCFNLKKKYTYIKFNSVYSKKDLFDLESANEYLVYSPNLDINGFYGNQYAIKKIEKKILGEIEHGLYFGYNYFEEKIREYPYPYIYTFSNYRKKILDKTIKKYNKKIKVKVMGPYIKLIDGFYDEIKKQEIKKKYGKILLVFPSHSIEGVISEYNSKELLEEVKKRALNYDNVFICMYWKDILEKKHLVYLEEGFQVITCGHRSSSTFLSKLRSIIEMSDMTMSNNLGTHIGYCVALGKSHYYFNQEIKYNGEKVEEEFSEQTRGMKWKKRYEQEKFIFIKRFENFSEEITPKQRLLVERYFGK